MSDEDKLRRQRASIQLAKEFERERARSAATQRKSERIKRKLRDRSSGKPTPAIRRDVEFDELLFKGILASLAEGEPVRLTSRKGPGVTDYRQQRRRRTEDIENPHHTFHALHWDHTGDRMKALAWGLALKERSGTTFSLHLSEAVIAMAEGSQLGFATFLRDRIKRKLRHHLGQDRTPLPDFFFMVETKPGTPAHLHGGIIIPEAAGCEALVRKALKAAGGDWGSSGRQLDLRSFTSAIGWVRYVSKWRLTTTLELQDRNIVAATSGLRALASAWYKRARSTEEVID